MIVADASVVAAAFLDDGPVGDSARKRLAADPDIHAPHLLDLEVMSVIRRKATSGDVDERRAGFALTDLEDLPIVRYPHIAFARRVWKLRHKVTVYDAVYLALAETLDCIFVTADEALARVPGLDCEVELLRR